MRNVVLEEGFRCGKLQVVKETEERRGGNIMWECICDCGKLTRVRGTHLKCGRVNSCGCQTGIINGNRERTHGASRSDPLYAIWLGIKTRCFNTKSFAYKDYGGRGITMSPDWINDFVKFKTDMQDGYTKGLTIERKEVNGNYEKSNCCWVTRSEQANNRRTTIYLDTELGVMKLKEAAAHVGICWQAMYARYKIWPKERWLEKHTDGK